MDINGLKGNEFALPKYPGLITRQELVDHCQERAAKLFEELKREEGLLESKGQTMSDEQYETLCFSKQTIIGHIAQLREITEWAKENQIKASVL